MRRLPLRAVALALASFALGLWLPGCVGIVGDPGTSYNDLVGATPVEVTNGVTLALGQNVVATAKPHLGELDLLNINLERLKTLGIEVSESNVLVTVEAATGEVLSAEPLGLQALWEATRALPLDAAEVRRETRTLTVPDALAAAGEFRANLFVCLDVDKDGACGDQLVEQVLGDAEIETQQVVAFVPFLATVVGDELVARALQENDPGFTAAEKFMQETLRNYQPNGLGDAAEFAANVTLATLVDAPAGPNDGPGDEPPQQPPTEEPVVCNLDECLMVYQQGIEDPEISLDEAYARYEECMHGLEGCDVVIREKGCFVRGTRIAVDRERSVPIEELRPGTLVMTSDGRWRAVRRVVTGPEDKPIIRVETVSGASLEVTQGHPMATDSGLRRAADLSLTDRLLGAAGSRLAIASLSSLNYTGLVFNIALEGASTAEHLLVAEDLVTGDLILQEQLSGAVVAARSSP